MDDRVLRIEVSDHSTTPPDTLRSTSELCYGLRLVDTLTSRWGVTPTTTGKTVWAELPLVTFFVAPDQGVVVARPGMTYSPSRTHDPGGGVTGFGASRDR
jgi:hypothetical protein